jgi:tetratricopeptide (TPR) repeat protein
MSSRNLVMAIAASGVLAGGLGVSPAQQPVELGEAQIGTVQFQISCDPAVSGEFNRAVALLHSFWFPEAIAAFRRVLERDPACGMAHWGIALSLWGNPFGGLRSPEVLERGREAAEAARRVGAKTARERAYIAAVGELYRDAEARDQRTRTLAYERAMEALARQYPDDKEAAAFYALAINGTVDPTDKTYRQQHKAAAILETLFREQPNHPGVAHYLIHTYDVPALAERGLPAARRYAAIAPAVPHALHMPSHTFTRLGYWEDSIASNLASAAAARQAGSPGEELHAMDYLTYAYLQTARDRAARRVLDEAEAVRQRMASAGGYLSAGAFALAAMPARYALERGAWVEAATLEIRPTGVLYADALTHFARALGAARSGQPGPARAETARLATLRDRLQEARDAYWAGQVDIQRRAAEAWVLLAEGRAEEALAAIQTAAELEEATDKAAVTPGPLAPARELLGEMLLQLGRAKEALAAFEATLAKEPNRYRTLAGAFTAAEQAARPDAARRWAAALVAVGREADTPRPDLVRARRHVEATR